ncbi:MAG: creatininase family protein [Daejeonella sp.]
MRILILLLLIASYATAQELPVRWDELTASDFPKALEKSSQTIILPIGILEKHGPHVPIGSDLIHVREWAMRATQKEYAVVFPDYFYGQINEARQQPGTFSLPSKLIWDMLDATIEEFARNGFKRIVIINGHAGEGAKGTPELGKVYADFEIESLAKGLKIIKADTKTLELQKEFYDQVDKLNK